MSANQVKEWGRYGSTMVKLPDPKSILKKVKGIILEAGDELVRMRGTARVVELRRWQEEVTEADLASEARLARQLEAAYPSIEYISEEKASAETEEKLPDGPCWIVDPLDGTTSFIRDRGDFGVQIGLVVEGRPVLGLVYNPVRRRLYSAIRGQGAFVEFGSRAAPKPLRVSRQAALQRARISLSLSDLLYRSGREQLLDALANLTPAYVEFTGGIGLKVCRVAEGRADIVFKIYQHVGVWDACAPQVILEEAGGKLTDTQGSEIRYNEGPFLQGGLIATNGILHQVVVPKVTKHGIGKDGRSRG